MPRSRYNFFIEDSQRNALRRVKKRDGISESEQIRRAITFWLKARGVMKKTASRRRGTQRKVQPQKLRSSM